ncbi:hypothetical protein EAY24_27265 [Vibrio anguillarum]|uniref:Uncharacterized protein n=15 Tax=Vibrio anguillarum TaxID=55601 RepID=A0A289G8C6_VIBAN|nr:MULTISPECIES: hypothetical protein [Vibrio]ASW79694.1 hypothetical protein CK207_00285 [Vibrio anguillarum]AXN05139.1 hypothetical protein DD610_13180 [Vibrio anguillarum]AZS24957.1 hypothetical protein DYL72_07755 [Vibrio anguillarum]MBF4274654.1 hypothetical protein [Vibrio anguillarum]MBF4296948.1 hypothetical protein [Vibrio anguillarum]
MNRIVMIILLMLPSYVQAISSLSEISQFAKEICEQIKANGSVSSTEVKAKLQGNAGTISKLIGAKIDGSGDFIVHNNIYKGIPYEELSVQMLDSRDCKLQLAYSLIDRKKAIEQGSIISAESSNYIINADGETILLMKSPNFLKYNKDKTNAEYKNILIHKTPIRLIESGYIEDIQGVKVSWSKVQVLAGMNNKDIGWTLTSNISFK